MTELCEGENCRLSRIESWRCRENILANLQDPNASHAQRLHVAGFLCNALNLTIEETSAEIGKHNKWTDYDPAITREQLEWFYQRKAVKIPPLDGGENGGKSATRAEPETAGPTLVPTVERPEEHAVPHADVVYADQVTHGLRASDERHITSTVWVQKKGRFRGKFSDGALECWMEFWPHEPERMATYRTVQGTNHTLLVIDLEAPKGLGLSNRESIELCWHAAQRLWALGGWWVLKFSGRRGFHVIAKLPGKVLPKALEALARERARQAGIDWALVDESMFKKRQLVRLVGSLNLKSGLRSVLVSPRMTVDEILEGARPENQKKRAADP